MLTPRLSTSVVKNKTLLPPDILKLIQESIIEEYTEFFEDKELSIEGCLYFDELLLRIGFREKDSIRQLNFESSVDYSREDKDDAMKKIYLSIDALQIMIEQFIEAEGDIELPQIWTSFDFESTQVWLKSSRENSTLETAADQLLREKGFSTEDGMPQTEGEETAPRGGGLDETFVDDLFEKLRRIRNESGSTTKH